ncbi:hypothetical protein INT46_008854 [Mucor plumbeus]|uniref:Uncharacterized protein n=1 Tax=Mucor plumbeus TaxID=97098 RepID=A0A8H7QIL9_9FUNG|nr:hypothetical protein INT46_008854 [Mucor plumbeus]
MEDDLSKEQFRVIKATANLLGKVLCKGLSEQELSIRFVEPLLTGLFDDPDNNVLLRFTGLITAEAKKKLEFNEKTTRHHCYITRWLELWNEFGVW